MKHRDAAAVQPNPDSLKALKNSDKVVKEPSLATVAASSCATLAAAPTVYGIRRGNSLVRIGRPLFQVAGARRLRQSYEEESPCTIMGF